MSRSSMTASAALGMPTSPSRAGNSPSFITPSPTRSGSSGWCTISASKSRAYVSVRRITWALVTLLSPSVKATAPAAFNRPISVISSPRRPFVSAAIGWILTIAVSRARRSAKSTVAELSITGEVSGWQMMVVMPPAAAAWLAEAKVSRWLAPGSPTKARMSISPGATTLPAQLTMSVPSGTPAAPMPRLASRIMPSAIRTSPGPSKSRDGSISRALASRIGRRSVSMMSRVRQVAGERFEHRHPHRHSHFHLLADQRLRAIRHDRVDLDAAVHRPRMHHQRIGFCIGQLLLVEAKVMKIFLGRGHERAVHALALQPQHHDDVGAIEALAHVAGHLDAHPLDAARQQRGRRHHAHPRAHGVEQQDIGARHPRMHDVAADRNDEPFEAALVAADGQRIEQRLGRMFVGAVAGVDHGTVDLARQ